MSFSRSSVVVVCVGVKSPATVELAVLVSIRVIPNESSFVLILDVDLECFRVRSYIRSYESWWLKFGLLFVRRGSYV